MTPFFWMIYTAQDARFFFSPPLTGKKNSISGNAEAPGHRERWVYF